MAFKYLKDIGIYSGPWNNWTGKDVDFYRRRLEYWFSPVLIADRIKWWFQRRKYGIDSRWCYNLNNSIQMMLYVSLKRYMQDADEHIDLEYHKIEFKGVSYTQKELINKAFSCFEKAFGCEERMKYWTLSRKDAASKEFMEIVLVLMDYLWW